MDVRDIYFRLSGIYGRSSNLFLHGILSGFNFPIVAFQSIDVLIELGNIICVL